MKRVLRHSFHFTRWTFACLILVVTLFLLIARGLSNYVEDYAGDIVQGLTIVLGVPVEVEHISTQWRGLSPEVSLNGVRMGEAESLTVIDTLHVKPDVLSSLMNWALVWSRFEAEGVDVQIRELPSGRWELAGIELGGSGRGGAYLEEMVLGSKRVSVLAAAFHFQTLSGTEIDLNVRELSLENALGFRRLKFAADFGESKNEVEFIAELSGSALRFTELDGLAYLRLDGQDISAVYQDITQRFWPDIDLNINRLPSVNAEFWANFRAGKEIQMQGGMELYAVPISVLGYESDTRKIGSNVLARYSVDALSVDFSDSVIEVEQGSFELPDLRVKREIEEAHVEYSLWFPQIVVENLVTAAGDNPRVPENLINLLSDLSPSGKVNYLHVQLPNLVSDDWTFSGQLEEVNLGTYRGAPAVKNLSGWFELNQRAGVVDVDSTDISILYPKVYEHWLEHSSLKGPVAWEINRQDEFVYVHADSVALESAEGRVQGAFFVQAPLISDYPTGVDLTLHLGLEDSSARHHPKLVPTSLPSNLRDWLGSALNGGDVPEAGMIYRGSTKSGKEKHRTVQVRVDAVDTELAFLEKWPSVENITDAQIWVSNASVFAQSQAARLLDIQLGNIQVAVKPEANDSVLEVAASLQGSSNSGLDIIRTTSLRDQVGSGLDMLDLQGDMQGELNLRLPLRDELEREDVIAQIDIAIQNNTLLLEDIDLQLDSVNGALSYSNRGIQSQGLNASIWGSPVVIEVSEDLEADVFRIETEGSLDVADIRDWAEVPILSELKGTTNVEGLIDIYTDPSAEKNDTYVFSSDLKGVTSNLPYPLGKNESVVTPLKVSVERAEDLVTRVDWQLPANQEGSEIGQYREFSLELGQGEEGAYEYARLAYESELPGVREGFFNGYVAVDSLDVDSWLELFSGVETQEGTQEPPGTVLGLKPELVVDVQDLVLNESELGAVRSTISYEQQAWKIDFITAYALGSYWAYEDPESLPLLDLDYLDLDMYLQNEEQTLGEDTGDLLDPLGIPSMQVNLESVVLNNTKRGSWSGTLRATGAGLWIDDLQGGLGTAMLAEEEGGASLFWGMDSFGQFTELNLTFTYEDIGDLFRIMALKPPLDSKSGIFYASLNWSGAPYQFSESGLNGIMGVNAQTGGFFTESGNVNGMLKTIGLFNVGSWTRRLRFDFSDVTAEGTPYDELIGDFIIEDDLITTLTPVNVELSSGSMLFDGSVDLATENVDARLVMTLPARQNMTWVAALVAGLPAAAGVWLAGKVFDEELDSLSSVSYKVEGPLDDPKVEAEKVFESTITE